MNTPVAIFVPYDSLARDENQPRTIFDPKNLAAFAERLWVEGIQSPIVATPDGDSYKILHGERRWRASALNRDRAAQILEQEPDLAADHPARRYDGWTLLPVLVNTEEIPPYLRLILQVGDNENREDLTLYERALAFTRSFEESPYKTAAEFCRATSMAEKTFSGYKSVLKARGPAKLALETGLICDIVAFRFFQQLPNEVQEALIDEANERETTLGRRYLEEQVSAAKSAIEKASAGASSAPAVPQEAREEESQSHENSPPSPDAGPPSCPRIDLDALSWLDAHLQRAEIPEPEDRHRHAAYSAVHEALTTGAPLIAIYEPPPVLQSKAA